MNANDPDHVHTETHSREREVVVTDGGRRSNGVSAFIALLAVALVVIVAIFAFNALSGSDGEIVPDEVDVNVDTGGGSGDGGGGGGEG